MDFSINKPKLTPSLLLAGPEAIDKAVERRKTRSGETRSKAKPKLKGVAAPKTYFTSSDLWERRLRPLAIIMSIASLVFFSYIVFSTPKSTVVLGSWEGPDLSSLQNLEYASVETGSPEVLGASTETEPAGASLKLVSYQGLILDRYFSKERSPLYGHGQDFIDACRKYGAPSDCTLLPAIAKVETDLCKAERGISARQHNCWGFGGGPATRILYPNFETAIDEITRRLMDGYGTKFFQNPNWGERAYCGPNCTSWGEKVQSERIRINNYFVSQGHPKLF